MDIGKKIRMDRIMDRTTKKTVIIPMDHGLTVGPIKGLEDMSRTINLVAEGGANAVLMHKGIIKAGYRGYGRDIGLIMHLSGSTALGSDPDNKVPVAEVEEAIKYGVDAVSVHINVGSATEPEQLKFLGDTAEKCNEWGMPLLAMMYPRGPKIKDQFDVEIVKHVARLGAELGADIVKTNYTGSIDTFKEVVKGCPAPVVMAGGPKTETEREFLQMVYDSIKAGGVGVASGRNVFQHNNPTKIVSAIREIVINNGSVDKALKVLGQSK